jgi:hypothetical protein
MRCCMLHARDLTDGLMCPRGTCSAPCHQMCDEKNVANVSAGTSACTAGTFYCRNRGHQPITLNSSFVDDNICGGCRSASFRRCARGLCRCLVFRTIACRWPQLADQAIKLKYSNKIIPVALQTVAMAPTRRRACARTSAPRRARRPVRRCDRPPRTRELATRWGSMRPHSQCCGPPTVRVYYAECCGPCARTW